MKNLDYRFRWVEESDEMFIAGAITEIERKGLKVFLLETGVGVEERLKKVVPAIISQGEKGYAYSICLPKDNNALGFYCLFPSPEYENAVVDLRYLYVKKDFRGRGVGDFLLRHAAQIVQEDRNDTLICNVVRPEFYDRDRKNVRNFFINRGFRGEVIPSDLSIIQMKCSDFSKIFEH